MTKKARSFRSGSGDVAEGRKPRQQLTGLTSCAGVVALSAMLSSISTLAVAGGPASSRPVTSACPTTTCGSPHACIATAPLALLAAPAPVPTATLTVTTAADVVDPSDGKLSLREAVVQANAASGTDAIEFTSALEGKTLVLAGGELVITRSAVIDGTGNAITLSGGGKQRILHASGSDTHLVLRNLTLSGGNQGFNGGAVFIDGGSLSMTDCAVRDSRAAGDYGSGGGIFAAKGSRLTITDSELVRNRADANGGGIATGETVALVIRGSTLSSNGAKYYGRGYGGGACFGRW